MGPSCKQSRLDIDENAKTLSDKIDVLSGTMNDMKSQLSDIFKIAKNTKVPLSLRCTIGSAFKCKICHKIMSPPVIFAKCCRSMLGCAACADGWYGGGPDGLMKSYPHCGVERGYAETICMAGIDEFLEAMHPLFDDIENDDEL